MAKDLFHTLDLNLLKTFMVLMQEKNMRKASQRLFVSQPAISQALQKLRNHFDEELFVKVKTGLEPTPFAESLANDITPHLDGLAAAVNRSHQFDPAEVDNKIRIALAPITMTCLPGFLFEQMRALAPNAQLELVSWSNSTVDEILKGETLIGVNYELLLANKEIYTPKLIDLKGRILVREGHPIKQSHVKPHDLSGYPIASLISPGWNDKFSYASQLLTDLGIEHTVGFRSELVMAIIDVVKHTDMYLPHSDLFPIEQFQGLRAVDVTIDGQPQMKSVHAHIHVRNRNNPLVKWLVDLIQQGLVQQADKVS
ncbi:MULTISPECIES: LysR family transcriptional regulator [Vibrio]|uniref:LysR family transcriptional regulator n=1 Tax=Vibrio TaxID=662 RepID=UPI0001545186|nr:MULTISPECIES: LysR family transcriptional regulator [Vibrio]EDL68012.1 transcriptional regulator, LysR family [Vibrio campbellii HY01]APX07201.1 LysR family transcriptional regulator [Vibrio campbellii]ARR07421.1 LysR family transcriptional regulator [Vibrio campbellii]AUW02941.1 LysR family transcriptional regulator [Vibrio campbellii]KGR33386.1 transcriptional regulator [Vibrio campbellii]